MTKSEITNLFKILSLEEQQEVLKELNQINIKENISFIKSRGEALDNKKGNCPHCNSINYVKFGIDKGSKRYRCKDCKKTFTEYTGTWMAKLHKKELILPYLELMRQEKSLDAIKSELGINKKTAFDWRHKVLASLEEVGKDKFTGITESDETFFLQSYKGSRKLERKPYKRGRKVGKKGISKDHVAVIATKGRAEGLDLTVATLGRIKKQDIKNALEERVDGKTVLCSDGHVSYKGFAKDLQIEHHVIRGDLKEYVKNKKYHIQHINSLHNGIKKWIDNRFWGVSTKYLQKYMNWYRIKEQLKDSANYIADFTKLSMVDTTSNERYYRITEDYLKLLHISMPS